MALRVVIAGGGTGGHLYPGIAVARELQARMPDAVVSFAGTARGLEQRIVPREGYPLDLLRSGGLKGKSLADRMRGAALLPVSLADAWRIVSPGRPTVTASGIQLGPVVLVARGIPTMVLEQNAVPGLTNRLLARVVRRGRDVRVVDQLLRAEGVRQRQSSEAGVLRTARVEGGVGWL
jgi:UDP-N-acetylglucosamine--N-acetylmuramyl-(pentapeptide) pyrophosphoryl-undecaprenol N-acetylglucosamine transferase